MKKILGLLPALLLALALGACDHRPPEPALGVTVTVDSVTPAGMALHYEQDSALHAGRVEPRYATLDQETDGGWVSLVGAPERIAPLYVLLPLDTPEAREIQWENFTGGRYARLPAGEYRLGLVLSPAGDNNPAHQETSYAYFTIQ